jgi:hypothetical protein
MLSAFYDTIRLRFGPLSQSQVDGIGILLDATEGLPPDHRAYVLATAWHETGPASRDGHMQPITERGPRKYFDKYDAGTSIGKVLGNTVPGDGYRFRGRGYVQITGRQNYQKASAITGVDLVANPDLALLPAIAARIIVDGMTKGWFTGKAMKDYADFQTMRRVVNGNDKAALIAGYAAAFRTAINLIGAGQDQPSSPPPLPMPPKPPAPAAEAALFRKPATAPSKPAEAVPAVLAPTQPATPETPPAARKPATAGFSLWGWLKRLFAARA